MFRQARWEEPTVFELGHPGRVGCVIPEAEEDVKKSVPSPEELVPQNMLRESPPKLPELSEVEVVRHFTRLSQMNYGIDLGIYPLGSCTMKYNPRICEALVRSEKLRELHPLQDERTVQGLLKILYELQRMLAEITGTDEISLQPAAGAHGELAGCLIIRKYHEVNGELDKRTEIIVPDSAHGTNPASARMAGFNVVVVKTREDGCVDLEALQEIVSGRTAGLMLTNPNTLGIFEKDIIEISKIIHDAGGLLYYDGANLNGTMGFCRPGDMGFDIVHINIHKTFSTPHGGGGPGAGPIGVKAELREFLPVPVVSYDGKRYFLDYDRKHTIGKVQAFHGCISVLVKAYIYLLALGGEGLKEACEVAVLNSNYLMRKLEKLPGLSLPYAPQKPRKHEFVVSAEELAKKKGVRTLHLAKALLDEGFYAPTIYFPLIVPEALMVEPTETEPLEEIDRYAKAFEKIVTMVDRSPQKILEAPHNTSVRRVDEVRASHPRTMCLSWRMLRAKP